MNRLILILFLVLTSESSMAANCTFVIMGGSKDWLSLMPGVNTDISIDVDTAVKMEAMRSGCKIVAMSNDTEADFLTKIKTLPKKAGMTYHLAFTDHGLPAGKNINDSLMITGISNHTTFAKFIDALKVSIPAGSHISYHTNNCYPNLAEALIANNLEKHFDICGGSSTVSEQMSWNMHDLEVYTNGNYSGPYGAVGLHFANDFKKKFGVNPSMSDFHAKAKRGDRGNLTRQPGLVTSMRFANNTIVAKKIKSPLLATDVNELLLAVNWKNDDALNKFLAIPKKTLIESTESFMNGSCKTYQANPFEDFLKTIVPLYSTLLRSDYDSLPAPYGQQSKVAKAWLLANQKKLAVLIATNAREKAEFLKKYKNYPKEKYSNVEEEWQTIKQKQGFALRDFEFNLRTLQEGLVLQSFMINATKEEKARYQAFLACENKPIY